MEDTGKKTSVFGDVLKANLAADMIKSGAMALVDMVKEVGAAVKGYISDGSRLASEAAENQAKLTQVMRNTMEASEDEIASIVELTNAQEQLGIVSSTVQQGGAQELGTYLTKTETLKNLIPVMNDMVAQQYGVNASQENAVNIATMLGKVMNGQVGALSRYGYSFDDAQAKILKFGTEEERAAVLAEVVGESVGGMNYALSHTDDGKMLQLNNTLEDTQRSVGLMANQWKAQMMGQMLPSVSSLSDAFLGLLHGEGSVEALASSFDEVFSQISDIITNFIPMVLDLGVQLVKALADGLSNNVGVIIDGAASVLGKLANALLDLLPIILDAGFKILMGLVKGIIDALSSVTNAAVNIVATLVRGISNSLPELIPAAVSAITTIVQGLIENLPQILDAALQIIIGLTDGILGALPVLIDALPAIISGIVDFIIDAIPQFINAGIELITSLVADLPTIIDSIVAAIPGIIDNIINAVIGAIPLIIDAGVKLLVSLIQNLPTIITTVVAAIPQIVGGLVEAIIGNIDKIILAGVQLLVSLVENTPGIIIEVVKAIPLIIEAIVNAIGSLTWQIVEAGSNLIKGLWQGISNVKSWIVDKIRGFMSDITSGIRSFFGINSPSTVFADIGRNLGLGIGVGFEDAMDQVTRDMQNAIPTSFDINPTVRGSYTGASGYGGAYPSGTVITQNIAITSPKALSEKEAAREFRNLSRKLALGM